MLDIWTRYVITSIIALCYYRSALWLFWLCVLLGIFITMNLSPKGELPVLCWHYLIDELGISYKLIVKNAGGILRVLYTGKTIGVPLTPILLYEEEICHTVIFHHVMSDCFNEAQYNQSLYILSAFNTVYIHYHILPELDNIQCLVYNDWLMSVTNHWQSCGYYYFKPNRQKALLPQVFLSLSTILKF